MTVVTVIWRYKSTQLYLPSGSQDLLNLKPEQNWQEWCLFSGIRREHWYQVLVWKCSSLKGNFKRCPNLVKVISKVTHLHTFRLNLQIRLTLIIPYFWKHTIFGNCYRNECRSLSWSLRWTMAQSVLGFPGRKTEHHAGWTSTAYQRGSISSHTEWPRPNGYSLHGSSPIRSRFAKTAVYT